MDRKLWEQLPVYRRLENEVKRHIADRRLKRHDRLPSESQLAAATVRERLSPRAAAKGGFSSSPADTGRTPGSAKIS